ncbi:hypothetical protein Goshw_004823 [Gossypium schwendimanii]|uniref:Uncharacterized protein n=1 Tax=Gossypium schwendimanii TaxID=34291 RepID=A0A7J9N9V9_GOSSC|nr:hypothetical protein [Gossypium schwendimanii]
MFKHTLCELSQVSDVLSVSTDKERDWNGKFPNGITHLFMEDSSSNFETDVDQVNNYVAFTSSVISSSKVEIDDDPDGDDEEEFLKTYKTMLGNWEQAKEELLTKELDNLINTKKELAETKLMLEKFNKGSNKLNQIHVAGRRDPRKSGLGFFNKRKEVMKSPTMFEKESTRGVASARN